MKLSGDQAVREKAIPKNSYLVTLFNHGKRF